MGDTRLFERQKRDRSAIPAPSLTRQLARSLPPLASPSSVPSRGDLPAYLEHAGRFGHAFGAISVHRPEITTAQSHEGEHAVTQRQPDCSDCAAISSHTTGQAASEPYGWSFAHITTTRHALEPVFQRATEASRMPEQPSSPEAVDQQKLAEALPSRENHTGLPNHLKEGIEALSGLSLEDVRVHYNSPLPAQVQAFAYTRGTEIHMGSGQEQYLPHEAWHVVQQKQGRVKPTMQAKGLAINDDEVLEREADTMGRRAMGFGSLDLQPSSESRTECFACNDAVPLQRASDDRHAPERLIPSPVIQRVKIPCDMCRNEGEEDEGIRTVCCKKFICGDCWDGRSVAVMSMPEVEGGRITCPVCKGDVKPEWYQDFYPLEQGKEIKETKEERQEETPQQALTRALGGNVICSHCGFSVPFGGGCDVMGCQKCQKNYNCLGIKDQSHTNKMEKFFHAVSTFTAETKEDQFILLAQQFPEPWEAMQFGQLHEYLLMARKEGKADLAQALVNLVTEESWKGFKAFLTSCFVPSGKDATYYQDCQKCKSLKELIQYMEKSGADPTGDLSILTELLTYEKQNKTKPVTQRVLPRQKIANQLKDSKLKKIVIFKMGDTDEYMQVD